MKTTSFLFLLTIIICSTSLRAQSPSWLRTSESAGFYTSHSFYSMTVHDGEYYLAGDFWRDIIFDDFSAALPESQDIHDAFVLKMNKWGESLDFFHFGGEGYERISDIAILPNGEVWLAGYFSETLQFNEMTYAANGYSDGFLLHMDENGEMLDFFRFDFNGSGYSSNIDQVEIDSDGNLWIVLHFLGTITLNGETYDSGFISDALVIEMKTDGSVLQTHHYASLAEEEAPWFTINDLVVDENDHVLVGGLFADAVAIDGEALEPFSTGTAFVQRWTPSGESDWLQLFTGGHSLVRKIAVSSDQIMVGVQFQSFLEVFGGQIDGSGSYADMAVVMLDEAGQFQWARGFVKGEAEATGGVYPIDLGYHEGQFYLSGFFSGTVGSEGNLVLESSNGQQAYLMTLEANGDLSEVHDFSSNGFSRIQAAQPTDDGFCFAGEFASNLIFQDTQIISPNSTLFYGMLQRDGVNKTAVEPSPNWTISPNPAKDVIWLNDPDHRLTNAQIVVYNEKGQVVKQWKNRNAQQPLSLSGLPPGIYEMQLMEGDQPLGQARFIKQ